MFLLFLALVLFFILPFSGDVGEDLVASICPSVLVRAAGRQLLIN
jgi:hypothetical protein